MSPKISVIIPAYNEQTLLHKALDSVPTGDDIQLILLDDGSTDSTWRIMTDWWKEHYDLFNKSSVIHRWNTNKGVAKTMNLGFDLSQGEYIVSLSSDDYYLIDFEQFRPYLDGENDLVYFNLIDNLDDVWDVTADNKKYFVGAVKFIRREFLGKTRVPDLKWEEDVPFTQELYKKNPKEVFTRIILKKYNWPHEGSLTWQKEHQNTEQ